MWKYYQAGDLFVSASTSETQGMTYGEALAAGVPLLCRKDSCLEGVVEMGKNGWQYDNLEQFLNFLKTWEEQEEGEKRKMRQYAEKSAGRFSTEVFGRGKRFRERYQIPDWKKVVISAGHLIRRKGIFDFLNLAAAMPETLFFWFGGGNRWAVPSDVKRAVRKKTKNVLFAGYVTPQELKEAYCGADAFAFLSYEETEGIVVLEALSCEIPVVARKIPVYDGWLQEGIFSGDCSEMIRAGRRLAEEHGIFQTGMRLNEIYQKENLGKRES